MTRRIWNSQFGSTFSWRHSTRRCALPLITWDDLTLAFLQRSCNAVTTYDISEYLHLIERFVDGALPVEAYERLYMDAFKAEKRIFDDTLFWLLNNLFTDLDVFEPDDASRLEYEIGFEELHENARITLQKLRDFTP